MVTSDFRPEVEMRPFRACAMHPAIIIGTVRSLWTWLWGRYLVPQNAFLVIILITRSDLSLPQIIVVDRGVARSLLRGEPKSQGTEIPSGVQGQNMENPREHQRSRDKNLPTVKGGMHPCPPLATPQAVDFVLMERIVLDTFGGSKPPPAYLGQDFVWGCTF